MTGTSVSTSTTTSRRWAKACDTTAVMSSNRRERNIFIACKIMHSASSSQMFSDYLVIIQTTKDTG
jgi:hypothetical protein